MASDEAIHVEGLADFQRALKNLEDGSQKKLKAVLDAAAEIVAERARAKVPVRSGKARASVRATSQQRYARVSGGGAKVPYYGWLDFGGTVGKGRSGGGGIKSLAGTAGQGTAGSVRRPFYEKGRYIYPAFYRSLDEVERKVVEGLVRLAKESGLTVDG